ncbi:Holliday junction resolvase RuvX [Egicoccus sp. AB-alg2]|uniref:Holliday junction resolvase RuvX n=1 Tax=Egicoccus sp. AB-alg2 TaxID=3242693 RepID=UPI00359E54C2
MGYELGKRRSDELPTTGRLLAIDLGEVRIGLAVSDPTQTIASPAETLQVPRNQDGPALDGLVNAVARHEVVGLVIGEPRQLDGSEGNPAQRSRWFAERLRARTGLPVALWDERFTTTEAQRVMLDQDASREDRRQHIDRVAASILLQSVLEAQRRHRAG